MKILTLVMAEVVDEVIADHVVDHFQTMAAMRKKEGVELIPIEDITQKIEADIMVVEEEWDVVDTVDKIEPVLPIRQKTTWTGIL